MVSQAAAAGSERLQQVLPLGFHVVKQASNTDAQAHTTQMIAEDGSLESWAVEVTTQTLDGPNGFKVDAYRALVAKRLDSICDRLDITDISDNKQNGYQALIRS
ncbi:hypothetical protein [Dyella sp.]|uniref:hypothetical protein n=1 Tax=Dyella sp. TaxID=1869338 RepID=UPI002ED3A6E7